METKRKVNPKSLLNLKPVKKGEIRNPKGAGAHDQLTKALRNLTIKAYRDIIEMVLTNNLTAIKELAQDPKSSTLQVAIATCVMTAINKGDYTVIERIAERIIGKIPEVVNINSNVTKEVVVFDRNLLKQAIQELESDV